MYSGDSRGQESWATVATATAAAWEVYQSESGGGCARGFNKPVPPGTECPGTPDYDAVARAFSKAPDADISAIIAVIKATNYGKGPNSRAGLMNPACLPKYVKAMMGGGDCKATKVPSQPQMLFDLVEKYGAPETEADLIPGSGALLAAATSPMSLATLVALGLVAYFAIPALRRG